jgi:WD40 repeat protein
MRPSFRRYRFLILAVALLTVGILCATDYLYATDYLPLTDSGSIRLGLGSHVMKQTITGRTVWQKKGADLPVFFSPGGDWIGAYKFQAGIVIFPTDSPSQETVLPPAQPVDIPITLTWCPTSENLLASFLTTSIEFYDLNSRQRLWTLPDHYRAEWSADGRYLGSGNRKTEDWDLLDPATGKVLQSVPDTSALLWAPNNQVAFRQSPGWFGNYRFSLVETQQWKEQARVPRRVFYASNVRWSPDSRFVVVSGPTPVFGPPLGVWILDGQQGKVLHKLRQYVTEVRAMAWSPDSRYVALTRATRESNLRVDVVTVHDVRTGAVVGELTGPAEAFFALHWDATGKHIRGISSPGSGLTLWEWAIPPLGSG